MTKFKMEKLQEILFSEENGVWISEKIQLNGTIAAIRIEVREAIITIERSITGMDFTAVPDFNLLVSIVEEFNITDAVPGQFIRIVSTCEPVKGYVLI